MVRFSRMFVFQKTIGPQNIAILVLSLPETKKTVSDSHFLKFSSALKQCPGDTAYCRPTFNLK